MDTDRLRLRRWDTDCDAALVRLAALPEMMRFIGPGEVWSREKALEVAVRQRDHWKQHGFGWWGARRLRDEAFVGFIGLNFVAPGQPGLQSTDIEIGWWVDPVYWGCGYAREGAQAAREFALESLGAPSVVARIHRDNEASIAVAEAIGMKWAFASTGTSGGPIVVYRS